MITREQIREVWRLQLRLASDVPADRDVALGVASICELALRALDQEADARLGAKVREWKCPACGTGLDRKRGCYQCGLELVRWLREEQGR